LCKDLTFKFLPQDPSLPLSLQATQLIVCAHQRSMRVKLLDLIVPLRRSSPYSKAAPRKKSVKLTSEKVGHSETHGETKCVAKSTDPSHKLTQQSSTDCYVKKSSYLHCQYRSKRNHELCSSISATALDQLLDGIEQRLTFLLSQCHSCSKEYSVFERFE
jgi:hypothetical protein